MGLFFAAVLFMMLALFAAAWSLRYAWARLTGRPVIPFVVRIDPRAGFGRVWRRAPQAEPARPEKREIADVTDVEAKPPRP